MNVEKAALFLLALAITRGRHAFKGCRQLPVRENPETAGLLGDEQPSIWERGYGPGELESGELFDANLAGRARYGGWGLTMSGHDWQRGHDEGCANGYVHA